VFVCVCVCVCVFECARLPVCVCVCSCVRPCVYVCANVYVRARPQIPSANSQMSTRYNTLQHTALHCNTLQHTAARCNTLQYTATHYIKLQHTAAHCNTLQHTAAQIIRGQRAKTKLSACMCSNSEKSLNITNSTSHLNNSNTLDWPHTQTDLRMSRVCMHELNDTSTYHELHKSSDNHELTNTSRYRTVNVFLNSTQKQRTIAKTRCVRMCFLETHWVRDI